MSTMQYKVSTNNTAKVSTLQTALQNVNSGSGVVPWTTVVKRKKSKNNDKTPVRSTKPDNEEARVAGAQASEPRNPFQATPYALDMNEGAMGGD